MNFIYKALPFGSAQLKTTVCLMPFAIIILVIACRVYSKVYITKATALIITLGLLIAIYGLIRWLENL